MKIHRILIALATATAFTCSWADARLPGTWSSVDANNGALNGTIVLEKKGSASLAAEGNPLLKGTWKVATPGALTLTMGEHGSSNMKYRFEKSNLVLTYDNGNEQHFARPKSAAKKTAVKPTPLKADKK